MENAHLMNSKSSNARTSHRQQLWNYCIQQSIPNLTVAVSRPPPWSSDVPTFTQADNINYSSDNIETLSEPNFWNNIASQPSESSNKQIILNNANVESIQHIRKTLVPGIGRPQMSSDSAPNHPFSLQNLTSRDNPLDFVKNLHKNQAHLPIFAAPQAHSLQHSQQIHHQISQLSPGVSVPLQDTPSYASEEKYAPVNFSSSNSRKKRERNKGHSRGEEEKVDIPNPTIPEHFYERILPVIHHNMSQQQNGSGYDFSHWNLWSNQKHQVFSDQGLFSGQIAPRHGSNLVEKSTHNHQSPIVPQPEPPQGPLSYFSSGHSTHHDSLPDYQKSSTSIEYCSNDKPKIITNDNKSYDSNTECERLVIVPNIEEELGFLLEPDTRATQTYTHTTADTKLNKDSLSTPKNNFLGSYIKFLQGERDTSLLETRSNVGPKKSSIPKSSDHVSNISSHAKTLMQTNHEPKLEQTYGTQVDLRHTLQKSSEDMRRYFDSSGELESDNSFKESAKLPHSSVPSLEISRFQNLENTKNLENVSKKIVKKDKSSSFIETPSLPYKKDIIKQKEKQRNLVELKREMVDDQHSLIVEPVGTPKRTKYVLENDYSTNKIKSVRNLYPNLMNNIPSNMTRMSGIDEKFSHKNRAAAPTRETNPNLPPGYGILELVDSNYETGDFVTLPNGIFRLSTSLEG